MNFYISMLPFIDFLRKTGLEISIEESIQAQNVINLGHFNTREVKVRQTLKSILVRRRIDYEIFDSCFDIYFLKYQKNISNQWSNFSYQDGAIETQLDNSSLEPQFPSEIDSIQGRTNIAGLSPDGSGQSQGLGLPNENEEYQLVAEVLENYQRWVPSSLQEFSKNFLSKQISDWEETIVSFTDYIFGFGQYRHSQTIAERYNRFSSHFIRAYSQLMDDLKKNEEISIQIKYLEQLEFLKLKIETFLSKIRLYILQMDNIDSNELLRYLYSSYYLPSLKKYLNDDFSRIEGDFNKVQQYLLYLGKKIAIQERKRRIKAKKGKINFRKTIRKNISVGGTLLNLSYHKKKRKDPKIIFLSDVSGSTEWISEFFFVITYAAQSTFKKFFLFEFDSTTVEITKGLKSPTLSQALLKRIQSWENPPIRSRSGHSNYQTALEDFFTIAEKYFSKNTNILILGDCRDWLGGYKQNISGGYDPESKFLLDKIAKRVKRVVILNPEQKERWNTGDSIVSHFEEIGAKIYHVDSIM
ncbi:MAG: VWA domain-containing protein, partial [Candidatus Heimdallarchaeota archaeon]